MTRVGLLRRRVTSIRRARTSPATTRSCSARSSAGLGVELVALRPRRRTLPGLARGVRRLAVLAEPLVDLRRRRMDRGRRGAAPRGHRRGAEVRRHLLRSSAARAGARRQGRTRGRRMGRRRAGVRDRRPAALHGSAASSASRSSRATRTKSSTCRPTPRVIATATNGYCPVAGLAVGERAWTLQGHPEFVPDLADHLLAGRVELIGAERVAAARASLTQPLDRATVARWIANFFVD